MLQKASMIFIIIICALVLRVITVVASEKLTKGSGSEAISEEAFIYGFPMVMAYNIIYDFSINKNSGQYKGPFNKLINDARVFTPADTAVVTPNSDTPYSFLLMDLRTEPMILCVPEVEKNRYYSIQLVSLYTFNFGYIGSRATGNDAGCYALVGPNWNGEIPAGIKKVFRSETDFAIAIYRTQLFNAADIDNVKNIQKEYKALTLSKFLHRPAPIAASEIEWPKIDKKLAQENPFAYLSFLLQFAPPINEAVSEIPLRENFAKIGIEAGKPFSLDSLTKEQKDELANGARIALEKIKEEAANLGTKVNHWNIASQVFGNRASYNGDWTKRAAAAMAGIFGNDPAEALYPMTREDSEGQILDGSKHNYTLTFAKGQLPPVNAFWSVTMYDGKSQLLVKNPINRYLINSPMLPDLKRNADGSITLYIQKDSPGKDKESNWLPAPNDTIYLVMRLYWPKEEALKGTWKPPAVVRINNG